MATMRISKPDAVRRQLEAAIDMLVSGADAFAVYTMASAAFRVVRDFADKSRNVQIHDTLKTHIRPGREKRFWDELHKATNFLTHAEKDPGGILEFEEEANDAVLMASCLYYSSLGYAVTPIMSGFMVWQGMLHPDSFVGGRASAVSESACRVLGDYRAQPRMEQLALGRQIVAMTVRQSALATPAELHNVPPDVAREE